LKLSQFHQLAAEEFGEGFASVVISDTRLTSKQDLTPAELLEAGEDPREIWFALCAHLGVPKDRWHGKPKTKQHAEN